MGHHFFGIIGDSKRHAIKFFKGAKYGRYKRKS